MINTCQFQSQKSDFSGRRSHLYIDLPIKVGEHRYIEDHQSSATNKHTGVFTPQMRAIPEKHAESQQGATSKLNNEDNVQNSNRSSSIFYAKNEYSVNEALFCNMRDADNDDADLSGRNRNPLLSESQTDNLMAGIMARREGGNK